MIQTSSRILENITTGILVKEDDAYQAFIKELNDFAEENKIKYNALKKENIPSYQRKHQTIEITKELGQSLSQFVDEYVNYLKKREEKKLTEEEASNLAIFFDSLSDIGTYLLIYNLNVSGSKEIIPLTNRIVFKKIKEKVDSYHKWLADL